MLRVIASSSLSCSGIADFVDIADIEDFVVAVAVGSKRKTTRNSDYYIITHAQITPKCQNFNYPTGYFNSAQNVASSSRNRVIDVDP